MGDCRCPLFFCEQFVVTRGAKAPLRALKHITLRTIWPMWQLFFFACWVSPSGGRAEAALGRALTPAETRCLAGLVFLRDIGMLALCFQAKAWPAGHGFIPRGHLQCGWHWCSLPRAEALAGSVTHLARWLMDQGLPALFAHHGRPTPLPRDREAKTLFRPCKGVTGTPKRRHWAVQCLHGFPRSPEPARPRPPRHFYISSAAS